LFGPQYDIHGGAVDLIFPHHEAEIAQIESISGRAPLARYWLHTGFLTINDVKMSRGPGNAFTIRNMLDRVDARLLRFFMLSHHYRSPIDYTHGLLDQASDALRRIDNFYQRLDQTEAGSSPRSTTRAAGSSPRSTTTSIRTAAAGARSARALSWGTRLAARLPPCTRRLAASARTAGDGRSGHRRTRAAPAREALRRG
jgi:cysteinyl-tRNA synthetase